MKYPTVSALCEGVAGAIREKEGSTALINPQDFVDRIKGLEVGGSGSKMRYFKVVDRLPSAGGGDKAIYSQMSQLTRCEDNGKVFINSGCYDTEYRGKDAIAYGVDLSLRINPSFDGEEWMTLEEYLVGIIDDPTCFEEITEEQFYDTTTFLTPQEITFTVKHEMDPVEYTALAGMTWEEFCNSDYNSGGDWGSGTVFFEATGDNIWLSSSGMGLGSLVTNDYTFVKPTDTIINGGAYKKDGLQ